MQDDKIIYISRKFYIGHERRKAHNPRRDTNDDRRHRNRTESLISDCRSTTDRRQEDIEGFIET